MNGAAEENRSTTRIAIGLVAAVAVAGVGWWAWQRARTDAPVPTAADAPVESDEVATVEPDAILNPLPPAPAVPAAPTQPPVEPDVAAASALNEVLGSGVADWLVNEQLARRMVATVDNLGRQASVEKIRPLRPPAQPFMVEREVIDATAGTERIVLAESNQARYDAVISMLADTDATAAANAYRRLYPQLQAAYEELGYPGRYFNDRVVAMIDHLLATPEREGPLLLEQPKVLYRFADPDLESRSPGQKLLLRIGPDHARTVKQKLREFRAQIATQPPANNNKE